MAHAKYSLPVIIATLFALILFLTCSQRNELYSPNGQGSFCYAFLCDTATTGISQIGDTVHFSTIDTIKTADSVTFVGIISPSSGNIRKSNWSISDGTTNNQNVFRKKFDHGGTYQGIFYMEDNAGLSMSDTVTICVHTPPGIPQLIMPLDSNTKVNPENDLTFLWSCNNPDQDSLVYKLYFDTSKSLGVPSFVPAIIHDTSIVVQSQNLKILKTYLWYVKAIDMYRDTLSSDTFWFRTKDPNALTGTCAGYACLQGVGHHSGIKIFFLIQGGGTTSYTLSNSDNGYFTCNTIIPGTYTVTATDTLRNAFQPVSRSVTITLGDSLYLDTMLLLDVKKPIISVSYPAAGDTLSILPSRALLFYGTLCDTGSNIREDSVKIFLNGVRVTNTNISLTSWSFTSNNIADGSYSLVITAKDSAGNAANPITQKFFVNSMTISAAVNVSHVSIKDTMIFRASIGNVNPPIRVYYWNFNSLAKNTWDDSIFTSASSDSVKWASPDSIATGKAIVKAVDDSGMTIYDTVSYTVFQDVPVITFLSGDTIVDHGGTVRCSVYVQQQFGTMTVEIDTGNSGNYKSLGGLGLTGGKAYSFSIGNACAWDSVKIRITDNGGNVVTRGSRVRIRPRPLTITSIDSTVNTITVHYGQTQETDFSQYRIYRNTTSAVDTTNELWATITTSGSVSYTTPTPNYAWNPRFYRVYQKDTEGVWSAGSNIVYGCIINSPPTTPVIIFLANNGDTILSQTGIVWNRSIDPNGNGVRYSVLTNFNNSGYTLFKTSLADTFIQLAGSVDSASVKLKVIAYDTLGDSSGWSGEKNLYVRWIGLLGMRPLTAGTFQMGQVGIAEPVHQVTLARNFQMDTAEITQADYFSLMGVNPSTFTGDQTLPVETMTWFDAVLYCNARSKKFRADTVYSYTSITGTPGSGCTDLGNLVIDMTKAGFRLPTEAQYEYACRAGTTTNFYWGDDSSMAPSYAWYNQNSSSSTHPVMSKLPNAWGLYDMNGNVWSWCNDWYGTYVAGNQNDPTGATSGSYRVIRGCAWDFNILHSASRVDIDPTTGHPDVGFRAVFPQ